MPLYGGKLQSILFYLIKYSNMCNFRLEYFWLLCLFLLAGCKGHSRDYTIMGTLPSEQYDGEWMYLTPMENPRGRIDSVKIANGSFTFTGSGEEMRVLRLRPVLRLKIQELLVVTEPGQITVKADSIGSVTGTPQNDALQEWKEMREKKLASYSQLWRNLKGSAGADSLALAQQLKDLRNEERDYNFQFLCRLGHNTLGLFMQEMLRPTLTDEQKKQLDESIQ